MDNRPHGFSPRQYLDGTDWNGQLRQYYIPSSDLAAYYLGDAVVGVPGASNGRVDGLLSIGVPQISKANPGDACRGVLVGVGFNYVDLSLKNIPATKTKDYLVSVVDDPRVVFEIQGDNTTTLDATVVGQFADFTVAAPSTDQGISATVLTTSTIANNPALPLRILSLASGDFSAYTRFLVTFNLHELS